MRLLVWLIIFPALALAPARDASVTGVVRDQNGAVIVGARVDALELASGRKTTTTTAASGRYELTGLDPGDYRVTVSGAGFDVAAKSVRLRAAGEVSLDFLLTPRAIQDAVTVTASKGGARLAADTPHSITAAGAPQIEARRSVSVPRALADVPNLSGIGMNPLAERPRLRGLASNRLLIIVDGERLNNVRSDPASGVSPAVVDVTQVESAEVLSGAGSSLYGSDAMAGTINLLTKEPARVADGRHLSLRFDGDARTNGPFRRAGGAVNFSTPRVALRAGGSLFRLSDYRAGGEPIPLAEVVRVGRFVGEISNRAGTNVARSYAVWELPAGGRVTNGGARGFYSQLELRLFASPKQSVRYRQLSNQHKDIGFAFVTPPFDVRRQSNGFRRLDKYGLRYEAHELGGRVPRLAVSFYRQKYAFPDDILSHSINAGSSWEAGAGDAAVLTGRSSSFTRASFTDGKSSVTSYGAEAQATFAPFKGGRWTTGLGYLLDSSADQFSRFDFSAGGAAPRDAVGGRASTPDTSYRNLSWSNLFEYEPLSRLRLSGGFRVDGWRSEARVTPGFPLGSESAILGASFDALRARPGPIDAEGAAGILDLVNGRGDILTSRTSVTGHGGVVLRLPGRVNPYFSWGTSYREPGVTERYILRNFGDPTFSLLLLPNTSLRPERGRSYEAGVKVARRRWRATLNYFRNDLRDFIRNEFSPALFVPADAARGLSPVSPSFPFHGVLYVQRANTARALIQGAEASYEVGLGLGRAGSVTPYGAAGWLKGSNLTPDRQTLALVGEFYNRPDTPFALRGSARDVPLPGVAPFSGVFGARYGDRAGGWAGEYELRYRARVTRVDPADLSTAIGTQYGSVAGLRPSLTQNLRAGYNLRRERYRVLFTAGAENLSDRLYFEPFQTAPAPGRSYVFGVTLDAFDLLRR